MTNETNAPALLNRESMDRIVASHGCTINTQYKSRSHETYVYLRTEGVQCYLGYLSAIEKLSEEQFENKVAARLSYA